jgi:hypothetical protein
LRKNNEENNSSFINVEDGEAESEEEESEDENEDEDENENEDEDDFWNELVIDEAQLEALEVVAESFEDLMFKMNETCKVRLVNL